MAVIRGSRTDPQVPEDRLIADLAAELELLREQTVGDVMDSARGMLSVRWHQLARDTAEALVEARYLKEAS